MNRGRINVFGVISLAGSLLFSGMAYGGRVVEFPPIDAKPVDPVKAPEVTTNSGEDTGMLPDFGPSQKKTKQNVAPPPNNITLLTKLVYGEKAFWKDAAGKMYEFEPWESFKRDGQGLTDQTTIRLDNGIKYNYDTAPLARAEGFDPVAIPVLFMTGDYDFVLTDREVENFRAYVLAGGTVLFNAARGREEFNGAVKREMGRVFKDKKFMRLSADHPVFHAKFRLDRLTAMVSGQSRSSEPEVYSMDIGTRAAVILVPQGLGSAMAGLNPEAYERAGRHLVGESAQRLAVNIMAYAMGTTSYGKFLAQEFPVYSGKTSGGDTLKFAQVKYAGSWDVNPAVQNSVMQGVFDNTADRNGRPAVHVDYAPATVTLEDEKLGQYPTVFMTGHYDFKLTGPEKAGLRDYLQKGGTLVVTSAAGLKPFDSAFKREMAEVLPDVARGPEAGFVPITPSAPMFAGGWNKVERVSYTPYTKTAEPNVELPRFYGLYVEGRLAVIYSPYDLMSGVNREGNGYAKGLEHGDAMRVLTNVVMYAMTN